MLISAKGTYALRVLADMARHNGENEFICVNEIAQRLNISRKYLETIMTLLAKNDIIEVARGKNGGYKLNRKPEDYRLIDILTVTENDLAPVPCLVNNCDPCKNDKDCAVLSTWKELYSLIENYFTNKTLKDIISQ